MKKTLQIKAAAALLVAAVAFPLIWYSDSDADAGAVVTAVLGAAGTYVGREMSDQMVTLRVAESHRWLAWATGVGFCVLCLLIAGLRSVALAALYHVDVKVLFWTMGVAFFAGMTIGAGLRRSDSFAPKEEKHQDVAL